MIQLPNLPRQLVVAIAGGASALLVGTAGVTYWVHARPAAQVVSSAQECVSAPDHVATLFSDNLSTQIRYSTLDYSSTQVLRSEPSANLPGNFDSLLALSSDSSRLAYVTADDQLMNNAHLWWIGVKQPGTRYHLADVQQGLSPVRPAWSPDGSQLAYVVGHTAAGDQPAGFQIWVAHRDGSAPPARVSDLPADTFARGNTASVCWTANDRVGILPGVDPATGQKAVAATKPGGTGSGSSGGSSGGGSHGAGSGSSCGVPVFSQNDPDWRSLIMQVGGDSIGSFGCALTSTTMLLNYYGATMSPAQLNSCLGPGADPLRWTSAPGCSSGKVSGGQETGFAWSGLDAILGQRRPAIVGMVGGASGMHFVVVTQGGGDTASGYHITDPWDGSTTKMLSSYTNVGYSPTWIVTYDGQGQNCARLTQGNPPPVTGATDGQVSQTPITVKVPPTASAPVTAQQVANGGPPPSTNGSPPPPGGSGTPTAGGGGNLQTGGGGSAVGGSGAASGASGSASGGSGSQTGGGSAGQGTSGSGQGTTTTIPPGGTFTATNGIWFFWNTAVSQTTTAQQVGILPHTKGRNLVKVIVDSIDPYGWITGGNQITADTAGSGQAQGQTGRVGQALPPGSIQLDAATDAPANLTLGKPGLVKVHALDTGSGVASVAANVDGSGWINTSDDVSTNRTVEIPTAGQHLVSLLVKDVAGNTTEVDNLPVTVMDVQTAGPNPTPTASTQPGVVGATGTAIPPQPAAAPAAPPPATGHPPSAAPPAPSPSPPPPPPPFTVTGVSLPAPSCGSGSSSIPCSYTVTVTASNAQAGSAASGTLTASHLFGGAGSLSAPFSVTFAAGATSASASGTLTFTGSTGFPCNLTGTSGASSSSTIVATVTQPNGATSQAVVFGIPPSGCG